MENRVIKTPCGEVLGRLCDDGVLRFLGVPYGAAARFCYPIETTCWNGVFDGTRFGKNCFQYRAFYDEAKVKNPFYYNEFRKSVSFTYGEDCLSLNVYAPPDAKNLPVAVFIHGGSFTTGGSDEKQFDGAEYAKRGIVFVTVNYRLNVFGFYANKAVEKQFGHDGNFALFDQLCAISWIKNNIAAFGGNPNAITLFGQSAGAMCIQNLIDSDFLDSGVKGAIMLSGGGIRKGLLAPKSLNTARRFFKKVERLAGCDDYLQLQKADARDVFLAWERASKNPISLLVTSPIKDNYLIKSKPSNKPLPCVFSVLKNDILPKTLKKMANRYINYAKKNGVECFYLPFNHTPPANEVYLDRGAFHSADLWYALGAMSKCGRPFTAKDYEISNMLIDCFAQFVKTQTIDNFGRLKTLLK